MRIDAVVGVRATLYIPGMMSATPVDAPFSTASTAQRAPRVIDPGRPLVRVQLLPWVSVPVTVKSAPTCTVRFWPSVVVRCAS